MKLAPFMDMVEAAANKFKVFYPNYYFHKQDIDDQYKNLLANLEQSIQDFTDELKQTDADRFQRLTEFHQELLEKRRKHWAEYQIDFDILWEKQAAMRAKYPQYQLEDHPVFKQLYELRLAQIPPQEALMLIDALQIELTRAIATIEDELEQATQRDQFDNKEKEVLRAIILNNPKVVQKLLHPSNSPTAEETAEQQKLKIILAVNEQIKRIHHSWWNPFMPNKTLLANKQAILYQLIHNFYDAANAGKTVECIFNEWQKKSMTFEKQPTLYSDLLGYHRNFFFKRNRPGVQTTSEEIINDLKNRYGRVTL